jgi:hypothetical protein
MGVGGYNVNPSISRHALGPMFRSGSENAQYEAGGHQHPSSRLHQRHIRSSLRSAHDIRSGWVTIGMYRLVPGCDARIAADLVSKLKLGLALSNTENSSRGRTALIGCAKEWLAHARGMMWMSSYLPEHALELCGSRHQMDDAEQTGEFRAASRSTASREAGGVAALAISSVATGPKKPVHSAKNRVE